MNMFFTVIVVAYNAGDRLSATLESILSQQNADFRVIVKDACSSDGSFENARAHFDDPRIEWISSADKGIYDGMNQALTASIGNRGSENTRGLIPGSEYVLFLNCGDLFHDKNVLENVSALIERSISEGNGAKIYYGEIIETLTGQRLGVAPYMDAFACFRNVPNHQAILYDAALLSEEHFDIRWRVRADYEHFLRCVLKRGEKTSSMDIVICDYEGGGFSESPEGRKISADEHKEITRIYFTGSQRFRYRAYMILTLQPLRHLLATHPLTTGAYNRIRRSLLKKR